MSKIERVRGTSDLLPQECEFNRLIQERLVECIESFGYRLVDAPVIEHTELYLQKSGPDIVSRLYDFTYQGRRLALRPEMTASVTRAYVDSLQGEPLPLRLCYAGPVFRYEKPQRGRFRQFTHVGLELIGSPHPMADAEIIYIACKGLNALGLKNYEVIIGHVGILAAYLEHLGIQSHLRSLLMRHMEALRQRGQAHVMTLLGEVYSVFQADDPADGAAARAQASSKLADLLAAMDESDARQIVLDFLDTLNIQLDEARDQHEIVDRLMAKIRNQRQTARVRQALDFMSEIGHLVGEPGATLAEAEKVIRAYGLNLAPIEQLRAVMGTLQQYPLDWSRVRLDLGMSRGLEYYTGAIFEIHHGAVGDEMQMCGGGRYDELIGLLGARNNVAAAGFAYGLERVAMAARAEGVLAGAADRAADALVIPVSAEDVAYAIQVAEQLRDKRLRVEIDTRGRSVKGNLQYAGKRGIPFAVVVGSEERAASAVVLKNMESREEQRMGVDDAIAHISRRR